MKFEKKSKSTGIQPMSPCAGCSNKGGSVYQGNYSSQAESNAGRCTPK